MEIWVHKNVLRSVLKTDIYREVKQARLSREKKTIIRPTWPSAGKHTDSHSGKSPWLKALSGKDSAQRYQLQCFCCRVENLILKTRPSVAHHSIHHQHGYLWCIRTVEYYADAKKTEASLSEKGNHQVAHTFVFKILCFGEGVFKWTCMHMSWNTHQSVASELEP